MAVIYSRYKSEPGQLHSNLCLQPAQLKLSLQGKRFRLCFRPVTGVARGRLIRDVQTVQAMPGQIPGVTTDSLGPLRLKLS